MSQRRMFSPQIVESEEFLSMPTSSQALYFHLGMGADDDGFIQPKIIMRQIGSADDDLKVLLAKRFLLPFESGVVVIKHWLIHNLIQKDRYHPTRFQEEKKSLFLKENKAYTDRVTSVNKMLPEVRLGKDSIDNTGESEIRLVSSKEEESRPKTERVPKAEQLSYEPMVKWSESERGFPFLTTERLKQYKALSLAKKNGLKASELKDRWEEMSGEKFWMKQGYDWMNVVLSFNKRRDV